MFSSSSSSSLPLPSFSSSSSSSSSSPEELLWTASTSGDLATVAQLASSPSVDVNWQDPQLQRTAFYRACGHGRLHVVNFLLQIERVDVNKTQHQKASPLLIASEKNHVAVVERLLSERRIDVNSSRVEKATPLFVACQYNLPGVVKLLLSDLRTNPNLALETQLTPLIIACQTGGLEAAMVMMRDDRVDVNLVDCQGCSALWMASQNGHLAVVKALIASGRPLEVELKRKSDGRTAGEIAQWLTGQQRLMKEDEEIFTRRRQNCPLVVKLLTEYQAKPEETRKTLRREFKLDDQLGGEIFALLVLLCDNYLQCKKDKASPAMRFFNIASKLPMDLQMVLCNRLYGVPKDVITSKFTEPAFQMYIKPFFWREQFV